MRFLAERPWHSLLLLVGLLVGLGFARPMLESRYEVEDFFPQNTLVRKQFDEYRQLFERDDRWAFILVEKQDVFGLDDFQHLAELERRLKKIEQIEEVHSPNSINIPIRDIHNHLALTPAFSPNNSDDPQRLAKVLFSYSQAPFVDQVLSGDQKIAIVSLLLHKDHLSHRSRVKLVEALEIEKQKLAQKGYQIRLAGYPIHRVYLSQDIAEDAKQILPMVLGVLALFLLLVFRNLIGVLAPFLVAGASLWLTICLMALLGIPTNILSPALFVLVLLMGVSDSIHLLSHHRERGREGRDKIQETVQELLFPCFLTSITTSIAFLGLAATGIPMITHLGLGVAVGVVLSFLVTFLLIPPLLSVRFLSPWFWGSLKGGSSVGKKLFLWQQRLERHPRKLIAVLIGVSVCCVFSAQRIQINSPLLADLRAEHPIQEVNHFMEDRLGGLISVDLLIYPIKNDDMASYSQKRMESIASLAHRLQLFPEVVSVSNPVDMLRQLQPLLQRIPREESSSLMPVALLLADKELRPWVNFEKDVMRIRMRIQNLNTKESLALFDRIEKEAQQYVKGSFLLTGQGYISQRINHEMSMHFMLSFGIALALVALVLLVAFQNSRYLIAILPANLFPLLVIAGVMGGMGIELRYTSALALTVAFGIVVDDSIHMLSRLDQNKWRKNPIEATIQSAGVGIFLTSFILGIGFLSLLTSRFLPNQILGGLLAVSAFAAVLGDLLLLPILLRSYRKNKLFSVRVRVSDLRQEMIDLLFALFQQCYSNTIYQQFVADLKSKDWILLLRLGEVGEVKGFSTIKIFDIEEKQCRILYSGDTVVDPKYWGQKALQMGFSLFVFRLRFCTFGQDVYWMLTTKGYKTYLLLTNYFPCSWPRYDNSPSGEISQLIAQLGEQKYGDKYNKETGIIHAQQDFVRDGITMIGESELSNPHIRYFLEKNPDYAAGSEMLCLAQIRWREPFRLIIRSLWRSLQRRRKSPSTP